MRTINLFAVCMLLLVSALAQAKTTNRHSIHIDVGPAYISQPDSIVGGPFQFDLEGGAGGSYTTAGVIAGGGSGCIEITEFYQW